MAVHIYIVEDDKNIREIEMFALKNSGYAVEEFENAKSFFSKTAEKVPDLVLLDIMLPDMDGLEIVKKLRSRPDTVRIPIILVTAKTTELDKVKGLDIGADDYLTKPFSMKELLARIRAMTRRQEKTTDSILQFSDIQLDRSTYQLSNSEGTTIRLANKEYQMLEMLMTNPGQVISVDQFMDKIWGYDSEAEFNVVWVYISYLRKKLSSLHAHVQIKATRGVGYSLIE